MPTLAFTISTDLHPPNPWRSSRHRVPTCPGVPQVKPPEPFQSFLLTSLLSSPVLIPDYWLSVPRKTRVSFALSCRRMTSTTSSERWTKIALSGLPIRMNPRDEASHRTSSGEKLLDISDGLIHDHIARRGHRNDLIFQGV